MASAWAIAGCFAVGLALAGISRLQPLMVEAHEAGQLSAGTFPTLELNTGPRSRLSHRKNWLGKVRLAEHTEILVLAGHADSQAMAGAGTPGDAVDNQGATPMQDGMRDELYWNLLTAQRIVLLGRQRGLNMRFYDPAAEDPALRSILDGEDPRTNWSVGRRHSEQGGYALEIHYDAYGDHGFGSGVIPRVRFGQTVVDEALAAEFGAFPSDFRGVLGAPERGITMLEIGKLEGELEHSLRDPATRDAALNTIADRVVRTIATALGIPQPRFATTVSPPLPLASPSGRPDGLPYPSAASGDAG